MARLGSGSLREPSSLVLMDPLMVFSLGVVVLVLRSMSACRSRDVSLVLV